MRYIKSSNDIETGGKHFPTLTFRALNETLGEGGGGEELGLASTTAGQFGLQNNDSVWSPVFSLDPESLSTSSLTSHTDLALLA